MRCARSALFGAAIMVVSCTVVSLTELANAAPTLAPGYSARVFASDPIGSTQPDSIAVDGNNVWIAYGNGNAADGSQDNLNSQVVHYLADGTLVHTFNVPGHSDGLKIDPVTHLVWALQNEDGAPNLRIINPQTNAVTPFTFGPTLHGGGYDDIAFLNGKTFISASSPAFSGTVNNKPVIVQATLGAGTVSVASILQGNTTATDLITGGTVTPNITDPDSMTVSRLGQLVLDDQSGSQLIFVSNPGLVSQTVSRLSLQNPSAAAINVDDTAFSPGSRVELLATERSTGLTYLISGPFGTGDAFSADPTDGLVGSLDLGNGTLTPIFTDANSSVRGLAFIAVPLPSAAEMFVFGGLVLGLCRLSRHARQTHT